jgi:hypothetical protein
MAGTDLMIAGPQAARPLRRMRCIPRRTQHVLTLGTGVLTAWKLEAAESSR